MYESIIRELEVINSRLGYQQGVCIVLEDGRREFFDIEEVHRNTGIAPNDLEVLIGSQVVVNTQSDDFEIKEYKLTVSSLMDFVNNHRSIMKQINKVSLVERNGSNRVILHTQERNFDIALSSFIIQTCVPREDVGALVGSFINPQFFNIGEKIGDYVCQKENSIIKELNLRYSVGFLDVVDKIREERKDNQAISGQVEIGELDDYESHTNFANFDKYNGPSDGYGGSLSDEFIDDALGGDPEAYWNID